MTTPLDTSISKIALATAQPIIEKGVRKLIDKVKETDNIISENFEIEGKETSIFCPERLQKYSLLLEVKKSNIFKNILEFRNGSVKRVTLRSMMGLQKIDAISISKQGFNINMKMLSEGEKYILDIEYYLDDDGFLDALIERKRPKDVPNADSIRYWMVAMLKHPEAMKGEYGRMDLYDVDFSVNVGIDQDLDTKVPKIFRNQLEQLAKVAGPLGRDEIVREYYKLRQLKSKNYGTEALELLGKLQALFIPQKFSSYIEVKDDFAFGTIERGINEFDVPLSWPRFMNVISRTDLTLEKPTAKGFLVYKKNEFLEEVSKIFD